MKDINPAFTFNELIEEFLQGFSVRVEGSDPERTACISLFHDLAETRIGDLSWVTKRYINPKKGEWKAFRDQVAPLLQEMGESILSLFGEYEGEASREAQLAHEADLLECLLQSREYAMQGYVKGEEWTRICRDGLKTETAKSLADACLSGDPGAWFQDLQRNPRLRNHSDSI